MKFFNREYSSQDPWLARIAVLAPSAIVITCVLGAIWLTSNGKVVPDFVTHIGCDSFITLVVLMPKPKEQA